MNESRSSSLNVRIESKTLDTESFKKKGFLVIDKVVSPSSVDRLNRRLEKILRGKYDKGTSPDKRPKLIKTKNKGLLGFSGHPRKRTLQIINVWKCDRLFESLVKSPEYVLMKCLFHAREIYSTNIQTGKRSCNNWEGNKSKGMVFRCSSRSRSNMG